MKKLFVSVPMRGREPEDIKKSIAKMKRFAEVLAEEEFDLIDSYISEEPPKDGKESVWYLSQAIEKLSQADVFIGISDAWSWKGCDIERQIAEHYGIEAYDVPAVYVVDNYRELMQAKEEESMANCPNCNF